MSIISTRRPECVLTCYNDGDIEFREITPEGLSAPRPLYQEAIDQIFANFRGDQKLKKFCSAVMPRNVLYVNPITDTIVWYNEPQRKRLLFTDKKHTGTYALPRILFMLNKEGLRLTCLKGIRGGSKVYKSIFPNMFGNNSVCMGSAQIHTKQLKYFEEAMEEAENKFFNSYFTHGITEELVKSRDKATFDKGLLTEKNMTIDEYIRKYV